MQFDAVATSDDRPSRIGRLRRGESIAAHLLARLAVPVVKPHERLKGCFNAEALHRSDEALVPNRRCNLIRAPADQRAIKHSRKLPMSVRIWCVAQDLTPLDRLRGRLLTRVDAERGFDVLWEVRENLAT